MRNRLVTSSRLTARCPISEFDFETTESLSPLTATIGQERAIGAIEFGLDIESHGYNIFVTGLVGTGRLTSVRNFLEARAGAEPLPDDWCYVYNFRDPDSPRALRLPAGTGALLAKDMDALIESLRADIPRSFEGEEYEKQKQEILSFHQRKSAAILEKFEKEANRQKFGLKRAASGIVLLPIVENTFMTQEEFETLAPAEKKRIEKTRAELQDSLNRAMREVRTSEKTSRETLKNAEREITRFAVHHHIEELQEKYAECSHLVAYLDEVQDDIIENADDFREVAEETEIMPGVKIPKPEPPLFKYKVNVIIDNGHTKGAPVVLETNPTYANLFGRIEHTAQFGIFFTNFTMIKPGAFHKANGGYVVVQALDVLKNFFSWDTMKRTIRNREIKIEDVGEQFRLVSTSSLKPEPIPVDVKVILIGSPFLYHLLYTYDEDFRKLFKVKADFSPMMDRTKANIQKYARFIATRCKDESLLHFDRSGVARVVEFGSWLVEDQGKLSARFIDITDIIRESHFWAKQDGRARVSAEHVERAIEEKVFRSNRIEERIQELMRDGTIMVDVEGAVIGQVNGISVYDIGDYTFGKPSRITAQTFAGKAGVINIEREAKLSGAIHNKGILIVAGYMGGKFAKKKPLTLSASVCFEQLYEEVEGDSASSTELYAILSSLSGLPLAQGIAVTGSVNQHGELQPIGGVNEKIEGFYSVSKLKGLTGKQGVIIPRQNLKNLLLKKEVIEAVEKKKFHIYAVSTIDEGMEILTGRKAGVRSKKTGRFPRGAVNYLVEKSLAGLARASGEEPPRRQKSRRKK